MLLQFQNHGLPELPVPPLSDCSSHTYLGHPVPVLWFYSPFNHGVESEETTVEALLCQLQNVSIRDHMENKECRKGAGGEGITNIFWLQSKRNRINRSFWSINNMYLLPFKNGLRYWNINRRDYLEVCHFSTSSELCRNAFTLKTVYTFLLIFLFWLNKKNMLTQKKIHSEKCKPFSAFFPHNYIFYYSLKFFLCKEICIFCVHLWFCVGLLNRLESDSSFPSSACYFI